MSWTGFLMWLGGMIGKIAPDVGASLLRRGLRFDRNAYWAGGDPAPYCSGCLDGSARRVKLHHSYGKAYNCPVCGQTTILGPQEITFSVRDDPDAY